VKAARTLGLVAAVVMVLIGGLWTFQGLGLLGGSAMTGDSTWAIVGPLLAGLGVALGVSILGAASRRP
jgi:hypothetical protein